jgi:hypothetical protein
LKIKDTLLCVIGLVLLAIPAIGSVYPVPPAPVNYFPYLFLGYVAIGVLRAIAFKVRDPSRIKRIHEELREMHLPGGLTIEKG